MKYNEMDNEMDNEMGWVWGNPQVAARRGRGGAGRITKYNETYNKYNEI